MASIAPSGLNASAPPPGLKVWIRFPLFTFSRYVVPLVWDPDFRPPDAPAASTLPFGLKATEDRMPATCGGPKARDQADGLISWPRSRHQDRVQDHGQDDRRARCRQDAGSDKR